MLALLVATSARADWPSDPSVNVQVSSAYIDFMQAPRIVSDGAGGAIVTIAPFCCHTVSEIYVQRIDSTGHVLWGDEGTAIDLDGSIASLDWADPRLVGDGAGGAYVFWDEMDVPPDSTWAVGTAKIQHVDASGDAQWDFYQQVVSLMFPYDRQVAGAAVSDDSGGIIAFWKDYDGGYGNYFLRAQRVQADGTRLWSNGGVVMDEGAHLLTGLFMAATSNDLGGGIVVVEAQFESGNELIAYTIQADGTPRWGRTVTPTPIDDIDLVVASDGAGGGIFSWSDDTGSGRHVLGQRIDWTGTSLWGSGGLALSGPDHEQRLPAVMVDGSGGAFVAYRDEILPDSNEVQVMRLDGAGAILWSTMVTGHLLDDGPAITSDGAGGVIVAWSDERGVTSDLYAQRLDGEGNPMWAPDGVPVSTAARAQRNPALVTSGVGGAIVAFEDNHAGPIRISADLATSSEIVSAPTRVPSIDLKLVAVPNPTTPDHLSLRFTIPAAGRAASSASGALRLFDVFGRMMASRDLGGLAPGTHTVDLGLGARLSAGLYFATVAIGEQNQTVRVVVLEAP